MNTLDKEEFRIKLEEINRLVEQQNYKGAMNVVDSIDWRRVKNVRTLCVVGEIYAANKRYEDSKEIFLLAYHRAPIGKNILYRLIEVSLKMGDIEEAMEFYEEFLEVAPSDNTQFILKYKIYKARNASQNELIKILEDYKEKEFTERWSYELAKLYYKAGEKDKCLDLCNEMVLWFSEGKYVMKALDLKMRLGSLTGEEREKYEQQFVPKLITPEEAQAMKENGEMISDEEAGKASYEDEAPVIESIRMNEKDINNAESLQEKISKGIRDIFNGIKKEKEEVSEEETISENADIQDEMIKNISEEDEFTNVPELEQEGEKKDDSFVYDSLQEEIELSKSMKMPELNIPESMKKAEVKEEVTEKAEEETAEEEKEVEEKADFDFNLEDTILAAASAQGIELPDEEELPKQKPVKHEKTARPVNTAKPVQNLVMPEFVRSEEDDDEYMSEEDLQSAEDEFLNGPANLKKEKIKPLEEDEDDELDEIPVKPVGMNTEVFNFQQEIKKVLKKEEDITNDAFFNEDLSSLKKEVAEEFDSSEEELDEDIYYDEEEEEEILSEEEELEQFIESIQPEEEKGFSSIVVRQRKLTEEESQLFTYLTEVPGLREQILDALCDVQLAATDKTSKTGNIIVMGGKETGKTRLISGLIPAICKELNLEASKVAYVFADQINGKDMSQIVNKLSGGFLVIEEANQLTAETVEQLNKAMEFRTDGLTVIIEDEKIGMRKLIAKYPKFAKKFTSMINIPVFTNDELVNFAKVYTRENGYTIDQMGMLALYNMIGLNQKQDQPMNIGTVKEMIDNAIAKSQGGIRKLKRNISKKHVDENGFIVLYEKDFS